MALIITSMKLINPNYFTIVLILVLLLISFITIMFHVGYLISLSYLCF